MTRLTKLAMLLDARKNCEESGNEEWKIRHTEDIDELLKQICPNVNFDITHVDGGNSEIVLSGEWHRMDENGYWDGWHSFDLRLKAGFYMTNVDIIAESLDELDKEYVVDTLLDSLDEKI